MNSNLLKTAIADAKTVKETAITNAKMALEEAFTPQLKSMFSQRVNEMEMEDENEEVIDELEDLTNEEDTSDLDELLAELGEMESMEPYIDDEPFEDILNTQKGYIGGKKDVKNTEGGLPYMEEDEEVDLEELLKETKDEEEDEEGSIEDMSEIDLKSFVEDVVKEMVSNGELEETEDEDEDEDEESTPPLKDEEEVSIDELLAEIEGSEDITEYAESNEEDYKMLYCKDHPEHESCKQTNEVNYELEEVKKDLKKVKKDLKESYNTIQIIKNTLSETKLLNAKLLYTNNIIKNQNLTESQKVKVLIAFDKAKTIQEAKLVYETLSQNLKKSVTNENLRRGSMASNIISGKKVESTQIMEVNDQVSRWQKLAGIKK